ncbi:MAG: tetratricopeptide repeat protein, partial [Bacteroidaceae bacterium]|nr:tetratricopeptide repeat protein [Bacteroidaceae bacterium]
MKKISFIIILTMVFAVGMYAQMPKEEAEATPNYTQALEAIQNGNDMDRATSLLEKEVKTNPTNGYAALLLGRICLLNQDNVGAISSLTKAAKALPKSDKESLVGCHLAKGLAYTFMNDNNNALKYYEQAKKTDPKAGEPYIVIAHFYERQGDSAKAAKTLAEALKADPKNAIVHEELGKRAVSADRHKEAIEHFSMAIEADPTNEDYLVERAVEYLQTDNAGRGADDILDAFQYWIAGGMQGGEKIETVLGIFIEYEHKTLLAKIQERKTEDGSMIWGILERAVYGKIPDRKAALAYFQDLYAKEGGDVGLRLAQAYYDNGLYSKALEVIESNKDDDDSMSDYRELELKVLHELGEKEKLDSAL